MLVDTHCHLNHPQFADDTPAVIAHAEAAGVTRMIVVGYDMPSSEQAVQFAEQLAPIYAAVAVHPHDSKDYDAAAEARLRALAARPKVVAIGEIGLDYHYDFSPRRAQRAAFRAQLALAREAGLPVIIHCREAYADVLDVLEEARAGESGGVMHCWAGTRTEAKRALELGLYLGFGGVLTFKNAEETRTIAAAAPLDRLLVETDAPYLAPVPFRGKRNEPAFTRLAAENLAELRGLTLEEIAAITTANARRLFARLE
jgi:TatD DNase family protein